jgi:hypothetical protein
MARLSGKSRPRVWLLACCFALGGLAVAQACNVPVFRFALERWRPDPYRVTVIHQGPLNESQLAQVAQLERISQTQGNLAVSTMDISAAVEEGDAKLVEAVKAEQLPAIAVRYPQHVTVAEPIWTQPLSSEAIEALTGSPVRRELVRRLAAGQTAVWLLLESGDKEQDEAAEKLIQEQLERLQKNLELPELTDAPADNLLTTTPLEIKFSLLRLPRIDAEVFLIESLVRSEPDLAERKEPMLFPVFGRGRALLPLIGAGITEGNIMGAAGFLTGACSCEVKALNPGFDLLLPADWDNLLMLTGDGAYIAGELASSAEPEYVPIPSGASAPITSRVATPSARLVPSPALPSAGQRSGALARGDAILISSLLTSVLGMFALLTVAASRR